MPNIPLIQSKTSATGGGMIDVYANEKQAGSGVGAALQGLGNTLSEANDHAFTILKEERTRQVNENVANVNAQFDQTSALEKARQQAPANGQGYAAKAVEEVDKSLVEYSNKIEDPEVRRQFLIKQRNELATRREHFAAEEAQMGRSHAQVETGKSLTAITNRVIANPGSYDDEFSKSQAVIDAQPGLTPAQKQAMKDAEGQRLAASRFQGMLMSAKTVEQADTVIAELKDEKWSSKIASTSYAGLLERAKSTRQQIETGEDAKISATIGSLRSRVEAGQPVPPEELDALRGQLKSMPTSRHAADGYGVIMKAEQNATYGKSPSAQTAEAARRTREGLAGRPDLPPAYAAASEVTGGRISATYLAGVSRRESGGQADAKNPNSSATGAFQFIDSTWLSVVRGQADRLGLERAAVARMSDAEILKLRNDPGLSAKAGALYAEQNANYLERKLGGRATDADLYLAHFLGPAGAVSFLQQMAADSQSPVKASGDFSQGQIDANRGVFFKKDGTAKTFSEVYRGMQTMFVPTQGGAQHEAATHLESLAKRQKEAERANMMDQARATGRIQAPSALQTPEDWRRQGVAAAQVAQGYGIPIPDAKPFDSAQEQALIKKIKEGTAEEVLGVISGLQSMGGDLARAGMKQLGAESHVFEHAAGLSMDGGAPQVAREIVQGQKAIEKNPAWQVPRKELGELFDKEFGAAFTRQLDGGAGSTKSNRQAVLDSAIALYVGRKDGVQLDKLDKEAFRQAVQDSTGSQKIGAVNGAQTVLPKGVKPEEFDRALDKLAPEDLSRMSATGTPPVYKDGSAVAPDDIAREGKFKHIGGNSYNVQMADGKFLATKGPDGRAQDYVFIASGAEIKSLVARPEQPYANPLAAQDARRTKQRKADDKLVNSLRANPENGQ